MHGEVPLFHYSDQPIIAYNKPFSGIFNPLCSSVEYSHMHNAGALKLSLRFLSNFVCWKDYYL